MLDLNDTLRDLQLGGEVTRVTPDGFALRFTDLDRGSYLALCEAISAASNLLD